MRGKLATPEGTYDVFFKYGCSLRSYGGLEMRPLGNRARFPFPKGGARTMSSSAFGPVIPAQIAVFSEA